MIEFPACERALTSNSDAIASIINALIVQGQEPPQFVGPQFRKSLPLRPLRNRMDPILRDIFYSQANKTIVRLKEPLAEEAIDLHQMLREDFLTDYGLTVSGLAGAIGVSRQSVNELLRGRRSVSPEMALRLAKLFGNSPEFWLNAQRAVDLWDAAQAIKDDVAGIKTLSVA